MKDIRLARRKPGHGDLTFTSEGNTYGWLWSVAPLTGTFLIAVLTRLVADEQQHGYIHGWPDMC
jgi:hypothetical protein